MSTLRKYASWILLSVFLPMLLVASVHVHHYGDSDEHSIACDHQHCGGHLGQNSHQTHECLLCQFLTLPYLSAEASAAILIDQDTDKNLPAHIQSGVRSEVCGIVGLRAPPSVSVMA